MLSRGPDRLGPGDIVRFGAAARETDHPIMPPLTPTHPGCVSKRLPVLGAAGVGLSIAGVGLVFHESLGAEGTSPIGDLCVLPAAVGVRANAGLSMRRLRWHPPLAVATYPTPFGVPVMLALAASQATGIAWGHLGAWAAVASSSARTSARARSRAQP